MSKRNKGLEEQRKNYKTDYQLNKQSRKGSRNKKNLLIIIEMHDKSKKIKNN